MFISRIARKKNLDYALRILSRVRGRVEFDVYGPIEDETYWRECQHLMARLPSTLTVRYCGVLPPTDVVGTFAQYDLFFFPTRGESFGYVVVESLLGGCPVLLSDQTPWQVGRANAGWNAPLQQPDVFAAHLETMVAMDAASFNRMSADARALGLRSAAVDAAVEASRRLFLDAAAGSASSPGVR